MGLNEVGIILGIILSTLGLVTSLYTSLIKMAKMEVQVDTMWEFLMKRAISEAVNKGAATLNSPLVFTEEAKSWFAPMKIELQEIYAKQGQKWKESQLCLEIEKQLGERILKEVCIPYKLYQGSCLLIAAEIAKGN